MLRRCFGLILAVGLAACASAPSDPPPPPSPGDCVTLRVWSNGFHTSLALQAAHLPEAHPLLALYPEAAYFLVGWGERDYFMDPEPGAFDALGAILPPSPSAVQVMAHSAPLEETLWRPARLVEVAVSEAGMARLAGAISETLERGADGAPVALGEGRLAGRSQFLAARPGFHLFYMCNHWTAQRLAEAGVPVRPGLSFTAGGLLGALGDDAPTACPP
ncbi:MAG: DUF2459 domain-containing protein [Pseudomonadota bacterium]